MGVDARIALCATEATVQSGMYETAFYMIGKEPLCISIPALAGQIEFGGTREEIKTIIANALAPHRGQFDVLILACTHYPIVADVFAEVVGKEVILFDPAYAVAARAKKLFWPQEVGNGTTTFLLSRKSDQFIRHVDTLLPGLTYALEVVE